MNGPCDEKSFVTCVQIMDTRAICFCLFFEMIQLHFSIQMEAIVEKMQGENGGVSVRTVKAFMSKVPSVFTGADLISWILKNLDVEDVNDAIHIAHLLSSHGYLFPIDDHQLTVKNDGTFYR